MLWWTGGYATYGVSCFCVIFSQLYDDVLTSELTFELSLMCTPVWCQRLHHNGICSLKNRDAWSSFLWDSDSGV